MVDDVTGGALESDGGRPDLLIDQDPDFLVYDPSSPAGVVSDKPHKTVAEAAVQLTRENAYWGAGLGAPSGALTFGFRTTPASYTVADETNFNAGFSPFTAQQQAAARAALGLWAAVANVEFVDLGVTDSATILFGNYASTDDHSAAFAYFPGSRAANRAAGDVWINSKNQSTSNVAPGTYEFHVLLHELGHSLGLSHPSDYNAGATDLTYQANASYFEDSRMYTVMSYFGSANTGGSLSVFTSTPMLDDVAAAQRLYGANTSSRADDTVYGFHSNAGSPFALADASQHAAFNVYDAGGNDTFDFSGYAQDQTIDLRAEQFSSTGGDTFNVSIASGVVIENAIGGSGADLIIGNAAANRLEGGAGDDRLIGGSGADLLYGGPGADRFAYQAASDSSAAGGTDIIADFVSGQDKLDFSELPGVRAVSINRLGSGAYVFLSTAGGDMQIAATSVVQGIDIINPTGASAAFGYDLVGQNGVDDLLLGSSGNDRLFGGTGNDRLEGGAGDDQLFGDEGADLLFGGPGADRFAYRGYLDSNAVTGTDIIADFESGIDKIDFYYLNNVQAISINRLNGGTYIFATSFAGLVQVGLTTIVQGTDLINPFGIATSFGYDLVGEDRVNDTLIGSSGNDRLFGGSGADVLIGGAGDDILYGDTEGDTLTGGPGADLFAYRSLYDSYLSDPDHITDFQVGVDKIDFRLVHTNSADTFGWYTQGPDTVVWFDWGGDGYREINVILQNVTNFQASDILI